jgi:hypothetical protein
MESGGVFTLIVYLAALPFALVSDVVFWFKRARTTSDVRANELAVASHGAGFLALAVLAVCVAGSSQAMRFMLNAPDASADWLHRVGALLAVAWAVAGLLWFFSGARRSLAWAGFRDSRLIMRAVVKIGFGAALWWAVWYPPASWPRDVLLWMAYARAMPISRVCIDAAVVWLVVTGAVKLLLVVVPRFASARGLVEEDIEAQRFDWGDE